MVRTLNTLRFIVIGMALALAVLATPAANAQSVTGSGGAGFFGAGADFKVNVYIDDHGRVSGSVTVKWFWPSDPTGQDPPKPHWVKYTAVSLIVDGSTATVTANDPDGGLHTFQFTDNGDGSTYPDYFNTWPIYGDITVTP